MDRAHVSSGSPYEPVYGYVRGLRVGDRVEISGTAPVPPPGERLAEGAYAQMLRCGDIVRDALAELGAGIDDVVRTRMFIVDPADADEVGRARGEIFGEARPVATMVVVAALIDPAWRVEVEASAVIGSRG